MFTKCKVKTVFLVLTAFFSVSAFSAELNADSKSVQKENSSNAAPPEVQFVQELQTILETGDLDKAIASFDQMPQNIKDDVNLLLIKASLLISASRLQEASDLTDLLEQREPSNIEVLEMKIVIAKARGNSSKHRTCTGTGFAAEI